MYFSELKQTVLSFEYFISRRILKSEVQGKKVSRPIVRIAMISITLTVVVNLITLAVVKGFQHEVVGKVTGFGSHLTIQHVGDFSVFEAQPIQIDQQFVNELKADQRVSGAYPVAYKPIVLQATVQTTAIQNGKKVTQKQKQIHGALLKGVDQSYDFTFFKKHLKSGRLPELNQVEPSNEVILSRQVARDLQLKLHDTLHSFFVKDRPVKRLFKLVGIYETGLEEFDRKMIIGDLRHVQDLSDWGMNVKLEVDDTLYNGQLVIRAVVGGRSGFLTYDWGNGPEKYSGISTCPTKDTLIRVIVREEDTERKIRIDTAFMQLKIKGNASAPCVFELNEDGELVKYSDDTDVNSFQLNAGSKTIHFTPKDGKGGSSSFVSAFEVNLNNWDDLDEIEQPLKKKFGLIPNEHGESLQVLPITEAQKDIFVWLGFLDVNVVIILALMFIIGIINMGSALLVLILVRTSFIGTLKALGASNWSIRKIFLYQAGGLILRGMLIGNIIGVGLCALQYYLKPFKLNPEVYYLDSVPIEFTWTSWVFLNCSTLVICLSALIIPSLLITRIQPVKAIKFN